MVRLKNPKMNPFEHIDMDPLDCSARSFRPWILEASAAMQASAIIFSLLGVTSINIGTWLRNPVSFLRGSLYEPY